jgi:hypothetical protein
MPTVKAAQAPERGELGHEQPRLDGEATGGRKYQGASAGLVVVGVGTGQVGVDAIVVRAGRVAEIDGPEVTFKPLAGGLFSASVAGCPPAPFSIEGRKCCSRAAAATTAGDWAVAWAWRWKAA